MVRALLTLRNTPDAGCKLSPAQIVLGRPLRDSLPYIDKSIMVYNNPQVQTQWRDVWKAKEDALRVRYVKTIENLSEHARSLKPLRHGDQVMLLYSYNTPMRAVTPSPSVDEQTPRRANPTQLQFGEFLPQSPVIEQHNTPPPPSLPASSPFERRSSRSKKPRTLYDADSGTYKEPLSVPEKL